MCINNEEGLFFPAPFPPSKHRSLWVNAELSQAPHRHYPGTSPGEGGDSWAGRMLAAECCLGLSRQDPSFPPGMPIAQILLFTLKHPPAGFPALDGMQNRDTPEHPPTLHGTPLWGSPRHVRPAEPAVTTSVCHSLPVPPELINKTSGVILAPGTGLSPGAQSCSFSVSPRRQSSLLFPSREQDVD